MKTLIFFRHGKSPNAEYIRQDIERPLTSKGYDDTYESAEWCLNHGYKPQLIISSPALRAYSTAMIAANVLSYPVNAIRFEPSVYDASVSALLEVIRNIEDKYQSVMLFGHNPGFSDCVQYISPGIIFAMPPAGVVVLSSAVFEWSSIEQGSFAIKNVHPAVGSMI